MMQAVVRPLYLLHESADLAARLRQVDAGAFRLVPGGGWDALALALGAAPARGVAVVDPRDPARPEALAGELRALLERFPAATVVAAFPVDPGRADDLRTLLQWGVADVIALGREDTPVALARRVQAVQARTIDRLLR